MQLGGVGKKGKEKWEYWNIDIKFIGEGFH